MELWKQKLQAWIVKNQKLQDELAEVKQIKAHFADLFKAETDKNLELGKEIKFFQSQVATALVERDQALLEVERCLEEEKKLTNKIQQLERRLELLTSNLLEQKKCFQNLQDEANVEREDSKNLNNVVQFFWNIRSKLSDCEHAQNIREKTKVLLQDSESSWAFGNTKQELAALQEEVCAAKESVIILERQLEEETLSKQYAKQYFVLLEQKLLHLTEMIEGKLRSFRSEIVGLKKEIMRTLKEEESWADSSMAAWVSLSIQINPLSHTSERLIRTTECKMCEITDNRDVPHETNVIKESVTSSKTLPQQRYESDFRDTKEALVIALEEKVAALLLLSQEDERRISKENMIAVREKKIAELHKQLLQVTIDKGDALIQVANLTDELARVQGSELQHGCQYFDKTGIKNDHNYNKKNTLFQWPLKSWFKGPNNMGLRSKAQAFLGTRVKDDLSNARFQAENSFLWGILSNLHKLCSSVNRLHQALVKVSYQMLAGCTNTGSDGSEQLDFVICEAQRLILAVGGSLPVSYNNQSHTEITVEDTSGMSFHASDCQGIGADLLLTFGRTSLEAILLAAEIGKSCLNKQRHY